MSKDPRPWQLSLSSGPRFQAPSRQTPTEIFGFPPSRFSPLVQMLFLFSFSLLPAIHSFVRQGREKERVVGAHPLPYLLLLVAGRFCGWDSDWDWVGCVFSREELNPAKSMGAAYWAKAAAAGVSAGNPPTLGLLLKTAFLVPSLHIYSCSTHWGSIFWLVRSSRDSGGTRRIGRERGHLGLLLYDGAEFAGNGHAFLSILPRL
jgi:hypothetical protein